MSSRPITKILPFAAILLLLVSFATRGYSQCCSTGSPVGASVYVGVLGKQYLRAIAYYRHSYSDTYYQGTEKYTGNVQLSNSSYNFTGVAVGYGITHRLTLEAEAGYYFDKTQVFKNIDFTEQGHGLSNGNITLKYGAYVKPAQQVEITAGVGLRYPFTTNPMVVNGVQLNRDVQPSTNAFGSAAMLFLNKGFPSITLRLFSINRYDYNFADKQDYKYGNILLNSVFVSKKLFRYCFGLLQVRSEWKTHDIDNANLNSEGGHEVINTGYWLLTLSPQLSYSISGKWNLTAVYDIPFYKNYNGLQMTPKYSFALSLTRDFNLGKKTIDPTQR